MKTLKSYDPNFAFLGARRYVQGATLTDGLLAALDNWGIGPVERIQGNFRILLEEQGRYDLLTDSEAQDATLEKYNVLFQIRSTEENILVGLKGRGEPVTKSVPYNEEALISGSVSDAGQRSAAAMLAPGSGFINTLIALNKRLVSTIFPLEGYGQWFLSRYDIFFSRTRIETPRQLDVRIIGSIGASNTFSAVELDGESVGTINFSRNLKK